MDHFFVGVGDWTVTGLASLFRARPTDCIALHFNRRPTDRLR
jgi:hypothetical protein